MRQAFSLQSLEAARTFARRLAAVLRGGDIIRLEGDLGAGKTEIARSIIQARAQSAIEVPSPTFTLVQHYELKNLCIIHADLYRLAIPDEIDELGLFDDPNAVVLIEWWNRAENLLPEPGLIIELTQGAADDQRDVVLIADQTAWGDRMSAFLP